MLDGWEVLRIQGADRRRVVAVKTDDPYRL